LKHSLRFPKYEKLQEYLDPLGFTCFPREFRLPAGKHPLVDFVAFKQGSFWAFEYKSFADSLKMGVEQCEAYADWFNYTTIVREGRLTRKNKYYVMCRDAGFGILLLSIDGHFSWMLDPRPQNPAEENINHVQQRFSSEPTFLEALGTVHYPLSPEDVLDKQMQEKELASLDIPKVMTLLPQDVLKLYVSIWYTGSFVEPRKWFLVVFSTQPIGSGRIETEDLKQWPNRQEIIYAMHYPGYNDKVKSAEDAINVKIRTVAEVIAEKNRMSFNIARDLSNAQRWPKLHAKAK
jgi:hypothetical protein